MSSDATHLYHFAMKSIMGAVPLARAGQVGNESETVSQSTATRRTVRDYGEHAIVIAGIKNTKLQFHAMSTCNC